MNGVKNDQPQSSTFLKAFGTLRLLQQSKFHLDTSTHSLFTS
jgi:hypothetical protein